PSTLTYTISVANTGNVSLTGLTLTDDTTTATLKSGDDGNGILDVNEIWVFEATYNATQTDINNGTTLSNTASVVTNEVPGPTSATANTTIDQNPLMTLVKDG
ncbi:hypothetical protein, partial [Christiangramia aquimixticola]|uniref:DUF7507 domain-containing protein n=1 Tax=Christiangramia aquimixticola TaxID=1697558 RepID=UPI003AA8B24C